MNAVLPTFGCITEGLPFAEALDLVLNLAPSPSACETVALEDCVGRVLVADIQARLDLPGFDQSAMDGYAVRSEDLVPGAWLPLTGRTSAGEMPTHLARGGAHRILTGAPLPTGADAVIVQERVQPRGEMIHIGAIPPPGANIRRRGEDIAAGRTLIRAGARLDWRHIGVLAAQGFVEVAVCHRPVVALLSSGRELRALGDSLAAGQIHDSNLPMLTALLRASGADVRALPVVADNAAAMRVSLREAATGADLVLTTAGISVGDEDHVRDALRDLGGDLSVMKVAMKPGKPLAAGRLGRAVFIGLPGNPQAALAGAIAFVRPLLARMCGAAPPAMLRAQASFSLRRQPGRTEFLLIRLHQRGATLCAERTGLDGSGRLAPLLPATGFAVLAEDAAHIELGTLLDVLPFFPGAIA